MFTPINIPTHRLDPAPLRSFFGSCRCGGAAGRPKRPPWWRVATFVTPDLRVHFGRYGAEGGERPSPPAHAHPIASPPPQAIPLNPLGPPPAPPAPPRPRPPPQTFPLRPPPGAPPGAVISPPTRRGEIEISIRGEDLIPSRGYRRTSEGFHRAVAKRIASKA